MESIQKQETKKRSIEAIKIHIEYCQHKSNTKYEMKQRPGKITHIVIN